MKPARILLSVLVTLALGGCSVFEQAPATPDLRASGAVAASAIGVTAEIGGKVLDVSVAEGDLVKAGDVVFTLDCALLQAQRDQTAAAIDVASAAAVAAEAQQHNAEIQYALVRQGVTQQDTPGRVAVWAAPADSTISVPNWYFQQSEQLAATQAELDAALSALDIEQANLQNELKKASNADFVSAEKRLAQAQVAYQIANLTDTQALSATENSDLQNASQALLDSATDELKAAQSAYDGMLTSSAAQSVLEARARVAAAQARLDNAQDRLNMLQTGSESLQLEAAQVGLDQAKAGVEQARSGKAQAEAALKVIDLQIEKCTVRAPQAGVITARDLDVGELVVPGGTVMVVSQLSPVTVTVYVPEDRYGQIDLGQAVTVSVDSFPGQTFAGTVRWISSEAEFTPRNVQTVSGRKATVYAVKVEVSNEGGLLKPGMPADVDLER